MKRILLPPFASLLILFIASCSGGDGTGKEALLTRIDSLQGSIDSISATGKLPEKKLEKLKEDHIEFANRFPDDSSAPHQLFRAGSLARSLKKPQKAINLYQRILKEYPEFSKEATVRFLLAFVYDQDLEKADKARELYQVVIDSFPQHKLAKDAEQYLKVMDLSDEELMERFEEKRKKRDSTRADSLEEEAS